MAKYPEDSIQASMPGDWWVRDTSRDYRAGRLAWAWVPYVDLVPRVLAGTRTDPENHHQARARLEEMRLGQFQKQAPLPVAGLPTAKGEAFVAQKGKVRPVLILGACAGMPSRPPAAAPWLYHPAMLVAPYYGVDADGSRGGIDRGLVAAVRWLKWPQFFWDMLPLGGPSESVLRLDNTFALGRHHDRVELTDHCLSERAVALVHDHLFWLSTGLLPEDGDLLAARTMFEQLGEPVR